MYAEYIQAALSKATYEIIEDQEPFFGGDPRTSRCVGIRKNPGRMSWELDGGYRRLDSFKTAIGFGHTSY